MTRRILLKVAYDGTTYAGFQRQKDKTIPTIEGALDSAVSALTGEEVEVIGASRTDAGVHAHGNVAVFDTASRIPAERFARALAKYLPEDIRVTDSYAVAADFHPRHTDCVKTYVYHVYNADTPDPLRSRYTAFTDHDLDVASMRAAGQYLVGEHDFVSFCSVHTQAQTTVRTILSVDVDADGGEKPRGIRITVRGTGFLYNMVRIIAGTLLEVGRGRFRPEEVAAMLEGKDRRLAGPTAPASGLVLEEIRFAQDPRIVGSLQTVDNSQAPAMP